MSITKPYTVEEVHASLRHQLISQGLQMADVDNILNSCDAAFRLWQQDRQAVDLIVTKVSNAIVHLKRYADDIKLSPELFMSMTESIIDSVK